MADVDTGRGDAHLDQNLDEIKPVRSFEVKEYTSNGPKPDPFIEADLKSEELTVVKRFIHEFPIVDRIRIFKGISPEVWEKNGRYENWMLQLPDSISSSVEPDVARRKDDIRTQMEDLVGIPPARFGHIHHDSTIDKIVALLTLIKRNTGIFTEPRHIQIFLEDHLENSSFTGESKDYVRLPSRADIEKITATLKDKKAVNGAFFEVEPDNYEGAVQLALRARKAMDYVMMKTQEGPKKDGYYSKPAAMNEEILIDLVKNLLSGEFPPKDFEDFS